MLLSVKIGLGYGSGRPKMGLKWPFWSFFLALYPLFLARQEFKNSGIPMPSLVFIQLILHAKLGKAWVLEIFLEKKRILVTSWNDVTFFSISQKVRNNRSKFGPYPRRVSDSLSFKKSLLFYYNILVDTIFLKVELLPCESMPISRKHRKLPRWNFQKFRIS